jgi:hypothetical protein
MSEDTHGGGWEESEDSAVAVQEPPASSPVPAPEPVHEPADDDEADVNDTPTEAASDEDESEEMVRDEKGRYRYKAKKDRAKPQDVGRINTLTKKLRTVEEELQRVRAQVPQPQAPAPPQELSPEPTIEQFGDKDDPYGAWQRALATWDRKREQAEAQYNGWQQHQQQAQAHQQQVLTQISTAHQQRLLAAVQVDPTAAQKLAQVKDYIPPALDVAIMLDDDSANVALFLADQNPVNRGILSEMVLLADSQPYDKTKPPPAELVGNIQRALRMRMNTAVSGSVTPSPLFVPAPRPPNPLRTAPMNTADLVPSDDNFSLEAHEKAFPVRRRRR